MEVNKFAIDNNPFIH